MPSLHGGSQEITLAVPFSYVYTVKTNNYKDEIFEEKIIEFFILFSFYAYVNVKTGSEYAIVK